MEGRIEISGSRKIKKTVRNDRSGKQSRAAELASESVSRTDSRSVGQTEILTDVYESMEYSECETDVLIVGAGGAGLFAALYVDDICPRTPM